MGRKGTTGVGITRERVLPEGVKLIGNYYSFEGIKVSKKMLSELDGEIISNNPFDIEFPENKTVGIWGYDPATGELVVVPRGMAHYKAIELSGRTTVKEYDRFVKGVYNKKENLLTIYTTRHVPRRGKEAMDEIFETSDEVLKKFLPLDTLVQLGTWKKVLYEMPLREL